MARFPEAERRLLIKMICMNCYARNAPRATRCRKCRSKELRPKAKEARKEEGSLYSVRRGLKSSRFDTRLVPVKYRRPKRESSPGGICLVKDRTASQANRGPRNRDCPARPRDRVRVPR